jgi:methionine-gamma-lyase
MAAISTTLWAYVRPGNVLLHSDPVYGGTDFLLKKILPQFGVIPIGFPAEGGAAAQVAAARRAQEQGPVTVIFVETPANPTNGLVDLAEVRHTADALGKTGHRPIIIVDNTMLGPLFQSPLALGADIVVASLTKYVGGHSDLIAGGCSGPVALLDPIRGMRTILGTMCDPETGWLLMRSLETLKLRMAAAADNARRVAEFLRRHKHVEEVWYLDFLPPDHPDRAVFERQCTGPGSTFAFEIKGGEAEAFAVLDHLKVFNLAVSLGGTESLASHPATMTHSDILAEEKESLGITSALIRLSVGIEDAEDLIADLDQALSTLD